MWKRRKFKEMEASTWFKSKRGRGGKKVEEDTPLVIKGSVHTGKAGQSEEKDLREGHQETEGGEEQNKVQVLETVCFLPYTLQSILRKRIQKADDRIKEAMRRPRIRFVKRGGLTTFQDTGKPNPWAGNSECERKN